MSVYGISDLHGNLPEWPQDAETVFIVGDICPDFSTSEFSPTRFGVDTTGVRQAEWLDTTFREWLSRRPFRSEVVAIWGNHDFVGEKSRMVPPDLPMTILTDREHTTRSGLKVYGTPWVPRLRFWAFYAADESLENKRQSIPEGLDVLLSHGPPYKVVDWCPNGNVGEIHLNNGIKCARPRLTLCGHIHESRGVGDVDGLPVVNCAMVDGMYEPYPDPFVPLDGFL